MKALIIDDHPLIQEAVANVLRRFDPGAEISIAGDCERGFEIAARDANLDLVLLDLQLPRLSGIDALKSWRARFPDIPIVILSAVTDQETVLAALAAGAAGFIPKSSSNEVMLSAVRLVQAGGKYVPSEALSRSALLVTSIQSPEGSTSMRSLGLTARQTDVLRLLATGASNKVIGRELSLAERTVKAHVTAVLRALGVSSRIQAAIAAAKLRP